MMLVPDEMQAVVYKNDIAPNLKDGARRSCFAHGFNIHFGQIVPPASVDVIMIAPKGPGHLVRRQYEEGSGVPCLIAVYQDATRQGQGTWRWPTRSGIGGTARRRHRDHLRRRDRDRPVRRAGRALRRRAPRWSRPGFETLVEAGYQPEIAYFECLHELKLIVDLMYEKGIACMRYSISDTAEYGDLTRGPRVIDANVRETMARSLGEIQNGEFAREWILENQAGRPVFNALQRQRKEHLIETWARSSAA